MSGNDVQRQIRGARVTRALLAVPAVIFTVQPAVHLADGALFLAVLNAVTVALFAVSAVLTTARIRLLRKTAERTGASLPMSAREAVLRRIASRPRRTMTPGDYRRLRELEAELGREPSTPPPVPELPAADEARNALTTAESVTFSGTAALPGSGRRTDGEWTVREDGTVSPGPVPAVRVYTLKANGERDLVCFACGATESRHDAGHAFR